MLHSEAPLHKKKNPFPQLLYAISNHIYRYHTHQTPASPTLTPLHLIEHILVSFGNMYTHIFNENVPPYFIISYYLYPLPQFSSFFFCVGKGSDTFTRIISQCYTFFLYKRTVYIFILFEISPLRPACIVSYDKLFLVFFFFKQL